MIKKDTKDYCTILLYNLYWHSNKNIG